MHPPRNGVHFGANVWRRTIRISFGEKKYIYLNKNMWIRFQRANHKGLDANNASVSALIWTEYSICVFTKQTVMWTHQNNGQFSTFAPVTWDWVNPQGRWHTFWMLLIHNLWLCLVESRPLLAGAVANLCLKKRKRKEM